MVTNCPVSSFLSSTSTDVELWPTATAVGAGVLCGMLRHRPFQGHTVDRVEDHISARETLDPAATVDC